MQRFKPKFFTIPLIALAAFLFLIFNAVSPPKISSTNSTNKARVKIGSVEIPVEVAQDAFSRARGLSGWPALEAGTGMLFIFAEPGLHRFWMLDMNFPIDIIWINDGAVIDITSDVSNKFNVLNPEIYTPSQPAQYVLEVNAGFVKNKGIEIGDSISFIDI